MQKLVCLFYIAVLFSCKSSPTEQVQSIADSTHKTDTIIQVVPLTSTSDTANTDNLDDGYDTCFVVIADTSVDYYSLQKKMLSLSQQLSISIDTMGRYYNASKDLIALPDNDEDEMYAGDYFPRRSPSESLSLEYLSLYKDDAVEKMIALVLGIYEKEDEAEKALKLLKAQEKTAFKLKAVIYNGCLH